MDDFGDSGKREGERMRAWHIMSHEGVDALECIESDVREPGAGEVAISMRASSINYRDLMTVENAAARGVNLPLIPNSCGAGEVVACGGDVTAFSVGDEVTSCFFEDWVSGEITPSAMASALGGDRPGVLAEYVVLPASGVIKAPAHLTFEEASTLPCAALTAWHALMKPYPVAPGETVLVLGTGGVSVFAQQFCQLMGVRTIVISSSDEKLEHIVSLGAGATINYRANENWEHAVLSMTDGRGVDRVVEVGGPGTLERSIEAARVGGVIALVGTLTGPSGKVAPTALMRKSITLRGIYVGSRAMFAEMNRAIEAHALRPVIDSRYSFEDAQDAYRKMRSAAHIGKVVIGING